jgi:hypothetical protein
MAGKEIANTAGAQVSTAGPRAVEVLPSHWKPTTAEALDGELFRIEMQRMSSGLRREPRITTE